MRTGDSRLSADTQVCMDGQTAIKQYVKDEYLKGKRWSDMQKGLKKLILSLEKEIQHEPLKAQFRRSMYKLAQRQYNTMRKSTSFGNLGVLLAVLMLKNGTAKTENERKTAEKTILTAPSRLFGKVGETKSWDEWYFVSKKKYGTELQGRIDYYWRDVKATIGKLAKQYAIDEEDSNDVYRRNSLRASAEIQVRQAYNEKQVAELREKGANLVICSSHADCSKRCYKWQGRVYSLDGSYGTTDDGRQFVPLEVATDVYYTTKAGRTYKNGLLGFNCRHRLTDYAPGKKPVHYDEKTVKRERKIDETQREFERQIIKAREDAVYFKNIDDKAYKQAQKKAKALMREYIDYSHENGRKYYTSRVRIF